MPSKSLDPYNLGDDEDWEGNAAAFTCPYCSKVFIVSGTRIHNGVRKYLSVKSPRGIMTSRVENQVATQAWNSK